MVDVPKMKYNLLGNSGLAVSSISIGNWVTAHNEQAEETAFQCFDKAIRSGVNFLDTAEAYGAGVAETVLGRILKRGEYERDQIVVSTKYMRCGPGPNAKNLSRKHLVQGLRNSMKRLQLDFVDIIFLHRFDHETPLRESINTVSTFIDQGKIDYWGTSQFTPFELSEIYKICDKFGYPYPNAEQSIYHMLRRDRIEVDLVPFYEKGLGTTTWSPLAGGLLTGKYNDGNVPEGSRFDTTNLGQTVRDLYFPDVS